MNGVETILFTLLTMMRSGVCLRMMTGTYSKCCFKSFHSFDPESVAAYSERDVQRLLANPGIVRNRLKIESAIKNARGVLKIQEEYGTLAAFLWQYVEGTPYQNSWKSTVELPARTYQSDAMSKDLQRRGFSFVGPAICYSFMQAVGMVNDHVVDCFRHAEVKQMARQINIGDRPAAPASNSINPFHPIAHKRAPGELPVR